jgi:hypothetical protein
MKKPGNKVIAVYLAWFLVNLFLLLSSQPTITFDDGSYINAREIYPTDCFYPFTKAYGHFNYCDLEFYDLTEFIFYLIAPILIYYAVSFWNKAPKD